MGKHCSRCNEYREYHQYHRDARTADGYRSDCILCRFSKHKYRRNRISRFTKEVPVQIHSRVCANTYEKLNYLATSFGVSKAVIIEAALKQYFEKHLLKAVSERIDNGKMGTMPTVRREGNNN
jgi:predicted DNA-binding protein